MLERLHKRIIDAQRSRVLQWIAPYVHQTLNLFRNDDVLWSMQAISKLYVMDQRDFKDHKNLDNLLYFWKVAKIDLASGSIVHVEQRPESEFPGHHYLDNTNMSELPVSWAQAHVNTKETVAQWQTEEALPWQRLHTEFGMQDLSTMQGPAYDSAYPFEEEEER